MWMLTLFLGALVFWLANYWVNGNFNYWKRRGIPHLSTSPFKLLFEYFFTKKGLTEIDAENYSKLKGHKFGGYFQMLTPTIMIRDPELVYKICVKDFSYFVDRSAPSTAKDLFTETLVNLTGDKWRALRHKLTPTFTSGKLKIMVNPIKECCDEVAACIDKKIDRDIDARDFMFKFVINVTGNVAFGLKVDALNEETEKSNEFLNISKSFFKPTFMLVAKFMVTTTMPKIRKFINFSLIDDNIDRFFRKLVQDMIAHREKTGEERADFLQLMLDQKKKEQAGLLDNSVDKDAKTSNSLRERGEDPEDSELLDQLKHMQGNSNNYEATNVFTDDCIVAQTFNFIAGGSETAATTLSFVLYELAANPNLQKKVQDEVDAVLSKNEFNYLAIKKMTYMEQFINESMRLHSVFPFLSRVCTQDYNIPETDVVLEKGSYLIIPIPAMLRDADNFPQPEKFDPDRFEDMDRIPQGTSITFGCGPRMCIAKRLAMLEMKILIATVLQKFTVTLSEKTKLPLRIQKSSVFQHVVGGLWVRFQERKFN